MPLQNSWEPNRKQQGDLQQLRKDHLARLELRYKVGAWIPEPPPLGARARDGKVGARTGGVILSYFVCTCSSKPSPKHSFFTQAVPDFKFLCCHSCRLILPPKLRLWDLMCTTHHHHQQRLYGLSQVGRGRGYFIFPGIAEETSVLDISLPTSSGKSNQIWGTLHGSFIAEP